MTFEIYYNISKRSVNASITPCIGRLFYYDLLPYSKAYCHIIQNLHRYYIISEIKDVIRVKYTLSTQERQP